MLIISIFLNINDRKVLIILLVNSMLFQINNHHHDN